jgi:hypothetical protein
MKFYDQNYIDSVIYERSTYYVTKNNSIAEYDIFRKYVKDFKGYENGCKYLIENTIF